MRHRLSRFGRDRRGTTAIEYGLIASLIVAVVLVAIQALGSSVGNTLYSKLASLF